MAFARLKGKVKQRLQGYKICKAVNSAFARLKTRLNALKTQREDKDGLYSRFGGSAAWNVADI